MENIKTADRFITIRGKSLRRSGQTKEWKSTGGFYIPVKFGLYENYYIVHNPTQAFENKNYHKLIYVSEVTPA